LDPAQPARAGDAELLYVPPNRNGVQGASQFIPSRAAAAGGRVQRSERDTRKPGVSNPALVPYEQVYGAYRDAAAEALRREAVPARLRDYVRQYFAQLEPQ
jgi:hypothetical protein